jgi:hypothetical protein
MEGCFWPRGSPSEGHLNLALGYLGKRGKEVVSLACICSLPKRRSLLIDLQI